MRYVCYRRLDMRTIIGTTRSGKPIQVTTAPPSVVLTAEMSNADVYDAYCAVTYLRVRERSGWRLVIDGGIVFRDILDSAETDGWFESAVKDSRHCASNRTFIDDINAGRDLVLPALRA